MLEDSTQIETQEWLDSLASLIRFSGGQRAKDILENVFKYAEIAGVPLPSAFFTPYCNTVDAQLDAVLPGDQAIEKRLKSIIRWNALVMVLRANRQDDSLGGHISSYASSATLYEVGFNHFFKGNDRGVGDLIYFQGHSAPGIYARSFVEGRLTEEQLDRYRREVSGGGLSSYPHPWLMPDYWQFPTVSMGLGPITAIHQAHVMRYMKSRALIPDSQRKVWAFIGDGECDEPEALSAISLAGRENLDNLIFVINCNLQRLDGPVRGNGKIVQELEGAFRGAQWNVIKVLWGTGWDRLLERDQSGLLLRRMGEVCDGDMQHYKANGGAYVREHFFGKYPELTKLVAGMTDDEIYGLNRGGNDTQKVYTAYQNAVNHRGSPTVILAQTVKGFGLGKAGESINTAHNVKKMQLEELKAFRDRFSIPVSNEDLKNLPYYRPDGNSVEIRYLKARRDALGGYIPSRTSDFEALSIPSLEIFEKLLSSSGTRKMSTTMAFVRCLSILAKAKDIGRFVVPIVPDEARTFGMEGMFRQLGIFSAEGQKYTPHDHDQIMSYKEDDSGQILQEGLNEAGAMSSWIACATAYSSHQVPLIPFYIYYSMFGFQRIGDLAWLSGDMRARGFLIGATAGRTTLNGEGLQHQDGHSLLWAASIPNCVSYDPTYAYEVAVIIASGLERMYKHKENVFYYLTVMNENYSHPEMPAGVEGDIVKGMYLLKQHPIKDGARVELMGSGTILLEVEAAAELLDREYGIGSNVWSVTSVNELVRDGRQVDRWNRLHPQDEGRTCYVTRRLEGCPGPVVIATDYMKSYAEQLRAFIPKDYHVLGTDGFGRSDTREKLREFFEVDRYSILLTVLYALYKSGEIRIEVYNRAVVRHQIPINQVDPLSV